MPLRKKISHLELIQLFLVSFPPSQSCLSSFMAICMKAAFQLLGVVSVAGYSPSEFISPRIAFIPAPSRGGVPSGRGYEWVHWRPGCHSSVLTLLDKCRVGAWAVRAHGWAAPPCIMWGSAHDLLISCQLCLCVWSAGSSGWFPVPCECPASFLPALRLAN